MPDHRFWKHLDDLVATSQAVIDRPAGSHHPRYPEIVYPLDYGYLEGTTAGDGDGIDIWAGSDPARSVTGVVCTVDMVKRDAEVKIFLGCTPEQMQTVLAFHDQGPMAAFLHVRPHT